MTKLIFVYGTLMSKYGNNHLLSEHGGKLVRNDIINNYRLYYSGGLGSFPVASPEEGHAMCGEIWDVSANPDAIMRSLDRLEGVPILYIRSRAKTYWEKVEVDFYERGPMFGGVDHLLPVHPVASIPDINSTISMWAR